MIIPSYLLELGKKDEDFTAWLDCLPNLVQIAKEKWGLEVSTSYYQGGSCSYVVPCVKKEKIQCVLKIGYPHPESLHEIEGLRVLNGRPTINIFDYDKDTNMMLFERCIPGTHLNLEPDQIQDQIICSTLREIWETPFPEKGFRPLGEMVELWNKGTYRDIEQFPNPELAKEGCKLKERLIESAENPRLLATDLHAGNVLRAKRREWLAIDVKPYIGDKTYDLTQHLLNCKTRLFADPEETLNKLACLAEVDVFRLIEWLYARLASENLGVNQKLAFILKQRLNLGKGNKIR